ncbi:hypothetical protein NY08_2798 [Rhodococcus sp. B7740]|nr:hypothetical protein NY08_2798 [Rhodococcus sp. B7740]
MATARPGPAHRGVQTPPRSVLGFLEGILDQGVAVARGVRRQGYRRLDRTEQLVVVHGSPSSMGKSVAVQPIHGLDIVEVSDPTSSDNDFQ